MSGYLSIFLLAIWFVVSDTGTRSNIVYCVISCRIVLYRTSYRGYDLFITKQRRRRQRNISLLFNSDTKSNTSSKRTEKECDSMSILRRSTLLFIKVYIDWLQLRLHTSVDWDPLRPLPLRTLRVSTKLHVCDEVLIN